MIENVLAVQRRVGAEKGAKCLFHAETVMRVGDKHGNIVNFVEISSIAIYPILLLTILKQLENDDCQGRL